MSRRLLGAAAIAAAALVAPAARAAYCPCFTASSAYNDRGCAIDAVAGQNPSVAEWNAIFDLVAQGPAAWGAAGPSIGDLRQGCDRPEAPRDVPAAIPCELLKAIAMQESGWRQFCVPDRPMDQVGQSSRTIISFDCGYGVAQITSGMRDGQSADFDRRRVAADPVYNLATGARFLATKWRGTRCVGDRQPQVLEHWYSAVWAYNGLSYVNNPNNPNYDPGRGVYDPAIGGAAPYQERVFGWLEHTSGRWAATAVAYPNPGEIGGNASPAALSEPRCASPTDCTSARPLHVTRCGGRGVDATGGEGAAGGGAAGGDGGGAAGGEGGSATGSDGGDEGAAGRGDDEGGSADPTGGAGAHGAAGSEAGSGGRPLADPGDDEPVGGAGSDGGGRAATRTASLYARCTCDVPGGGAATGGTPWLSLCASALAAVMRRRLPGRRRAQ